MNSQIVSVLKSIAVVAVGVWFANFVERKYLSAKVAMPHVAE